MQIAIHIDTIRIAHLSCAYSFYSPQIVFLWQFQSSLVSLALHLPSLLHSLLLNGEYNLSLNIHPAAQNQYKRIPLYVKLHSTHPHIA